MFFRQPDAALDWDDIWKSGSLLFGTVAIIGLQFTDDFGIASPKSNFIEKMQQNVARLNPLGQFILGRRNSPSCFHEAVYFQPVRRPS